MNEHIKPDALDQIMAQNWAQQFGATRLTESEWVVRVPFADQFGDPITISVSKHDNEIRIDDAGAVAGMMFSLGEHMQDTPTFRLMQALADSYELWIDHDEGLLHCQMASEAFPETLSDFAKVVLTLLTASPYLARRSRPQYRMGPRLKKRITDGYKEKRIIDLVAQRPHIPGDIVEHWPADFRWSLPYEPEAANVFVLAADLKVRDPLERAQKVSAIALDTQNARDRDELRVVIDTDGAEPAGCTAAEFILYHRDTLNYEVFDFGKDVERHNFFDRAVDELLSDNAKEWRLTLNNDLHIY